MERKTLVPTLSELAELAERAKRTSEITAKLAEEYRFLLIWYGMRSHSRIRPNPILDDMIDTWERPKTDALLTMGA